MNLFRRPRIVSFPCDPHCSADYNCPFSDVSGGGGRCVMFPIYPNGADDDGMLENFLNVERVREKEKTRDWRDLRELDG